jgi:hypothetical protein
LEYSTIKTPEFEEGFGKKWRIPADPEGNSSVIFDRVERVYPLERARKTLRLKPVEYSLDSQRALFINGHCEQLTI